MQCPKCHYQRQAIDDFIHPDVCPQCGIVYAKALAQQAEAEAGTGRATYIPHPKPPRHPLLSPAQAYDRFDWNGRLLGLLLFAVWGLYFIFGGIDWERIGGSFMHSINLPFHEFGHVLFRPFGEFMMILGGSLFQVLLPAGLILAFLRKGDPFGASLMLWWTGQSLIDVSPYIQDAQYRALPLIGGASEDFHDWGNLLTRLDMVDSCRLLARLSFVAGSLLILLSAYWGLLLLKHNKPKD